MSKLIPLFQDSNFSNSDSTENLKYPANLIRSSTISSLSLKSPEIDRKPLIKSEANFSVQNANTSNNVQTTTDAQESPEEICDNVSPNTLSKIKRVKFKTRSLSESTPSVENNKSVNQANAYSSDSESSASAKFFINFEDHNRTMVLQVGRVDLRLISPDRKLILLHKQNRDITTCIQVIL